MGRDEAVGAVAAGDGCEAAGGVVVAFVVADADGGDCCCCCCCCEEQGEEGELHFCCWGWDLVGLFVVDVCSGMIARYLTLWYIYISSLLFLQRCSARSLTDHLPYLALPYIT